LPSTTQAKWQPYGGIPKDQAARAIEELDLEETDVESFVRLGGQFYHTYPRLVKERGQEFRAGAIKVVAPGEI